MVDNAQQPPAVEDEDELKPGHSFTIREERFIEGFVRTASVLKAGKFAGMGKSNGTPYRMYARPDIQAAIRARREEIFASMDATTYRTIHEMTRVAYFDPRVILDEAGNLLPLHKWPDDAAAAVAGYEIEEEIIKDEDGIETPLRLKVSKIKWHNKIAALDLTAKHQGLYEKDHQQANEGVEAAAIRIAEGMRKLGQRDDDAGEAG